MTPEAIKQLQTQLGVPATGVYDAATSAAMTTAVTKATAANPDVAAYSAGQNASTILNAFQTGDWSGVTDLTGKPFSDEQQKAAVASASSALAPAYKAATAYDTATTEDTLRKNQEGLADTEAADATQFGKDKDTLDQSSADSGILFSGARVQKLNDLRTTYAQRDAIARRDAAESAGATARDYQYAYGNKAAEGLKGLYSLPGATTYKTTVPGGGATRSSTLSAVYDPSQYKFQGTKPVAQTAAVQTRAAGLLANRANKLSLGGSAKQF